MSNIVQKLIKYDLRRRGVHAKEEAVTFVKHD